MATAVFHVRFCSGRRRSGGERAVDVTFVVPLGVKKISLMAKLTGVILVNSFFILNA